MLVICIFFIVWLRSNTVDVWIFCRASFTIMSPNEDINQLDLEHFMSVALKLVHEAGEMIVKALDDRSTVEAKSANEPEGHASAILTETDTNVEKHIISGLASKFPEHRFIGEESMSDATDGQIAQFSHQPTWIIDPIDGTMNFVHANPLVCTSVALTVNRHVVLAIVNNPVTQSCYTAMKGKTIKVGSKKTRWEKSPRTPRKSKEKCYLSPRILLYQALT